MDIRYFISDNDGVNVNSEHLAMRIMDDEARSLIEKYNRAAFGDLPIDHIYKTFPGKSTDKIVEALIKGDWDRIDQINPSRSLPLDRIAKDLGFEANTPIDKISSVLADRINTATIKMFPDNLESVAGATPAWLEIGNTMGPQNLGLATTSNKPRMDASLLHAKDPETKLNARLHEIFPEGPRRYTGYGTPNKYDGFLAQIGWNAAECAIVEDSDSGVGYARAGRPDTKIIGTVAADFFVDKDKQAGKLFAASANIVISTMYDLPKAAQWLNDNLSSRKKPDFRGRVYTP